MEEKDRENKAEKLIHSLPSVWFNAFRDAFIFLMFIEIGYLIYKTTGVGSFLLVNFLAIKIFIFGFIYLLVLSLLVYLSKKYIIPNIKETRERRKKEFFEEVSKVIKKELKTKK